MATNLTSIKIRDSYNQLLHIDGGPDATPKVVYSAVGTATALKVGTASVGIDNILLDGNTITTSDANGNLILMANGVGAVNIANVAISSGTITGLTTPLSVASGGTGGGTQAAARTGLGLGTIATQNANAVTITGGTITGSYDQFTLLQSASLFATSSLGYQTGVGSGGTVVQATNKATGVTLNTPTGQITMNAASLPAATRVSFVLSNTSITTTDIVVVNIASGATADAYATSVTAVSAGSCRIQLANLSAGALAEAVVLNFAVIKGANT